MSTTEILREQIKKQVDSADEKALRMVKSILEIAESDEEYLQGFNNWETLPEPIRQRIEIGMREAAEGKGISHQEFQQKHMRWSAK